jgi:hypothetical protein
MPSILYAFLSIPSAYGEGWTMKPPCVKPIRPKCQHCVRPETADDLSVHLHVHVHVHVLVVKKYIFKFLVPSVVFTKHRP